jgi:hypothetical protein
LLKTSWFTVGFWPVAEHTTLAAHSVYICVSTAVKFGFTAASFLS